MRYINTITGRIITVDSIISGGDWREYTPSDAAFKAETTEEPAEETAEEPDEEAKSSQTELSYKELQDIVRGYGIKVGGKKREELIAIIEERKVAPVQQTGATIKPREV